MGGDTHANSMYEQVEDTEPKAAVTAEQAAEAAKVAAAADQAKKDQAADTTGASST